MKKKKISGKEQNKILEEVFSTFNRVEYLDSDPIGLIHRYRTPLDREIGSFIATSFAFGNVTAMRRRLTELFSILGPSLVDGIFDNEKKNRIEKEWAGYRFYSAKDGRLMMDSLAKLVESHGSIGNFFKDQHRGNIFESLSRLRATLLGFEKKPLSYGFKYWIPEATQSPSKRLHLFLRWVVRKDEIDFGLWDFIHPRELILPLDTHLHSVGLKMGFTSRKSADLKTALEMTESLRKIDPEDPIRFDFALCRLGMNKKFLAKFKNQASSHPVAESKAKYQTNSKLCRG